MFLLYQALTDTMQQVATQAGATAKSINLWELIAQGGVLMIPLALLLVVAVYFFVERNIAINKASRIDPNFMNIVRDHIMNGNITAARSLTKNTDHPVARIIDKGLQRLGKPIDAIEKSMENVGRIEMYNMERNINVLSMIAGMAPMFGFLGTIIGMIQMFYEINTSGRFELNTIAGGIYVKMITSATGLIIGLVSYLFYNYLNTQVDKTANKMEVATAEFLDTLQEPHK
ncbi:MotA/TolQ/ExbB proton channel family protein [Phnomibacter ginsenosidimutans]|jgi:biopolymer transport protein ExbB|uniref:MotA/TolQ/ExbB proton channel family protein n=1 Tax=Phnomibacter ginsenosidimutans TaxID=2676868 RepID=A0A6I6GAW5_9BACT|nr:MotA/TolQ/ExbB proton channel family protein [Phnomibacter ginsenosidimutans]QGW30036.1 MotA/TolQ/ExbB proton channel family protein [Phnomibacter ginsenosidimutans]